MAVVAAVQTRPRKMSSPVAEKLDLRADLAETPSAPSAPYVSSDVPSDLAYVKLDSVSCYWNPLA
eukprot:3622274-Pyramimonas_sp.AAC.1